MKKVYEFSAGRVGNGIVDLANGNMTFTHQTTDADSNVLSVALSHVYQSNLTNLDSSFGRGWKLNLHQNLQSKDSNNTHYVYTDGSGIKHDLKERYFIRQGIEKVYQNITRKDIRIDQYGRLWLIEKPEQEVFAEIVSNNGLILQLRPDGFCGSKKIETRHEELVRIESEIKSTRRHVYDLEESIEQNANFETPINIGNISFNSLSELQLHIQSEGLRIERQSITDFNANVNQQNELMQRQADLRHENMKGMGRVWSIISDPDLSGDNITTNFTFTNRRDNRWTFTNNTNARMMESMQARIQFMSGQVSGADVNQASRSRGMYIYQQKFQETCERIQQDIQRLSTNIENRNWNNQQRTTEERAALISFQTELQRIRNNFEKARLELMLSRWNKDLIEARSQLSQLEHIHKHLITHLPVNYIIADKILGFNEVGNLIAIFDNYDNHVAIIYQDGQISRVIDAEDREITFDYINNRLDCIKDFEERKTYFRYDSNSRLIAIEYQNGESSTFNYDAIGRLSRALAPSAIGSGVAYDMFNRVESIFDVTRLSQIDSQAVHGRQEQTEPNVNFSYSVSQRTTRLTIPKTNERITYFFNADNELLHEYIQGAFEQRLITVLENDNHEIMISERLNLTSNLSQIQSRHIGWINNPNTLPAAFQEGLYWQVAELNNEGNPVHKRYSQKAHPTKRNIRQDLVENFEYKNFTDNRQPLLIKQESITTTTNQPNRTSTIEYFYNKQSDIIRTVSEPIGMIEKIGYTNNGIVISSAVYHKSNPSKQIIHKEEVAENGQVLSSFDDIGQHRTTFDYIANTNKINHTTDPRGNTTVFGHDFSIGHINSLSSVANGEFNGTTYDFTADFLTGLESGNTKIDYTYERYGRKSGIKLNDIAYVSYSYSTETRDHYNGMNQIECDVVTAEYANEEIYRSYADKFGRLISVRYALKGSNESEVILKNYYELDENNADFGRLRKTLDFNTPQTTEFTYDRDGNVIEQKSMGHFAGSDEIPAQLLSIKQQFDIDDNLMNFGLCS